MNFGQTKEERVYRVFERIYENYDKMNSIISFRQHVHWRKDALKKIRIKKGAKALDLCCGTAEWSIAISRAVGEDGWVYGIDFSDNMLKIGKKKLEMHNINNTE